MTIKEFVRRYKITCSAVRRGDNPNMTDNAREMDHWTVTLRMDGRRMSIPFSKGFGHNGKPPAASEVLECLASDCSGLRNAGSFEDWCSDLGFDTDSRKAEATFKVVNRQCDRLDRFLDTDRLVNLLDCTEE